MPHRWKSGLHSIALRISQKQSRNNMGTSSRSLAEWHAASVRAKVDSVNSRIRIVLISLTLAAVVFSASCNRTKPAVAKRYPFTGRVVSIDAQGQSAVIDGDKIPGFMDAMAMSYRVKPPATLSQLSPGDSISAEVVVVDPDYWLENVKVTAHAKASRAPATTQRIPAPGDNVPNFSFTNQDRRRTSIQEYRGKVVLVTFIYTRCPFPDFCPRMSSNFAEIDKQLVADPALAAHIHLLSLSFDPEHDTPKVLRDYAFAVAHTRDTTLFRRWEFAAPRRGDLAKIADFFGLIVKPEGRLITHNLSTTVVGPDGKIVKWYHGGDWRSSDLIEDARIFSSTLSGSKTP
jgi:protein SCO1/2